MSTITAVPVRRFRNEHKTAAIDCQGSEVYTHNKGPLMIFSKSHIILCSFHKIELMRIRTEWDVCRIFNLQK